jgi:hypothetical protein
VDVGNELSPASQSDPKPLWLMSVRVIFMHWKLSPRVRLCMHMAKKISGHALMSALVITTVSTISAVIINLDDSRVG